MTNLSKSNSLDSEKTVGYVFQQAIKAEWQARCFYLKFSEMFSHISQVSSFWVEFAQDEEGHARALQKIQETLSDQQLAKAADFELLTNIKQAITSLRTISIDSINTLDDACELAHELEHSEVNSVFKVLTTEFVSQETRKKITFSQLGNHLKKLMKFTQNIGDKALRKSITAKHLVHQK